MRTIQNVKGYDTNDRISWLMEQILQERERFETPDEQSIYFQWGKENKQAILTGYIYDYQKKREVFNGTSGASFRYELNRVEAEMSWLREAKDHREGSLTPFIFLMGSLSRKRVHLEIYVKMKEVTGELPPVHELKNHAELVKKLKQRGL